MMSDRCRRLWSISTFTYAGGGLLQFCSVRKNRLSGSVDLPDYQPPNCRQYAEWPYRYHKLARKAALPERLRPFSLTYNQLNGPQQSTDRSHKIATKHGRTLAARTRHVEISRFLRRTPTEHQIHQARG